MKRTPAPENNVYKITLSNHKLTTYAQTLCCKSHYEKNSTILPHYKRHEEENYGRILGGIYAKYVIQRNNLF